jgi:predicted amidohydrolase
MNTLRVASTRFELRAETSPEAFGTHLISVATQAKRQGAELLVLPELVTTGLLASRPDADEFVAAELSRLYRELFPGLTDYYAELLRSLATETGMTIAGGSHFREASDGGYRNTAYVAHPDGRLEKQDKLHLTPPERSMGMSPGDSVLITRIGPFTAAVQICADLEFPEVSRHLASRGVDLILAPSLTWNRRGATRVRYAAHARAMENQLYVVTSTLTGTSGIPNDGALYGTGQAAVATPIDRIFGLNDGLLASTTGSGQTEFLIADLDLDLVRKSRDNPEPPGLAFIRPDLYESLSKGTP